MPMLMYSPTVSTLLTVCSNPTVELLIELVVRYHGTSIHVDHAMSTGNQLVSGRSWSGGAAGAVVQMEQMEIHPMGF